MRVERLGSGEPSLAVVAGVHGDEPCGVRAVERLLASPPAVERPVKLVVANERALERGVRYVDEDLNRAFPGDPDADAHERRLAHELARELDGCATLSLHSTRSHAEPFAVVERVSEFARRVCPRLSVAAVVETGSFVEGRLFAAAPETVEVECGLQGTGAAAENGERLIREFLAATGALADAAATPTDDLGVYRLTRRVPKSPATAHEMLAVNFERVAAGEPFATADGDQMVAEESFYPVLMSADGYESVFGYAADLVGRMG